MLGAQRLTDGFTIVVMAGLAASQPRSLEKGERSMPDAFAFYQLPIFFWQSKAYIDLTKSTVTHFDCNIKGLFTLEGVSNLSIYILKMHVLIGNTH